MKERDEEVLGEHEPIEAEVRERKWLVWQEVQDDECAAMQVRHEEWQETHCLNEKS